MKTTAITCDRCGDSTPMANSARPNTLRTPEGWTSVCTNPHETPPVGEADLCPPCSEGFIALENEMYDQTVARRRAFITREPT